MHDTAPGSIWPADDPDNAQIREVYARYGLAMYLAQVLEHSIVNVLVVFDLFPTMHDHSNRASWEAAFDRFYDTELGKTFGNMLKALQQIERFPPNLLTDLRAAKEARDHLAHRFFREHDLDFMTTEGRTVMIAECERLIERFQELDGELEAFAAPQRERFGITREWVETHVALMEREARAVNPS